MTGARVNPDKGIEARDYDRRWEGQPSYSARLAGYTPHFIRFMERWAGTAEFGATALDVGCGDGFFSSELRRLGFDVTGIDLSEVALSRARVGNPAGAFIRHDVGTEFPFRSGSFDVVWCSEHLEHLFSPMFALEQVYRVLRPGGTALLTVPFHGLVKNVLIALFAFEHHYDPTYPHIRFFTRKSLSRLVERAGLEVRHVETCGSGLGVREIVAPTNLLMAVRRPG